MKKLRLIPVFLLGLLAGMAACSDDNPVVPEPDPVPTPTPDPDPDPDPTPPENYVDGYNYSLKVLDADQPVTITFKAPAGSELYGCTGDMYLHSGVGATWAGAPTWNDNNDKYKLSPVEGQSNTWSITLSPSIRSYYGIAETTSIQLLNLIVRTPDGSKQTSDYATLVQDTKHNFTLGDVAKQSAPVSEEGIHVQSASSATLALYDYDTAGNHKDYAFVTGDFCNWQLDSRYQMNYDETRHCWWITLDGLPAGETSFQYFVYSTADGGAYLCDPYSEKVLEKNVDGNFPAAASGNYVSVLNTQPEPYNWVVNDFKVEHPESLVIYELLLRDFTSSHDLEGAKAKLAYLKEMGINAIELMPVQEFDGGDSWGYNTSFYFALDGSYGTQNQYKAFIDACHQAGIAVIFDVVYNHTNGNNPFAKLYWDIYNRRPAATNPWLNDVTPHQKYVFSTEDFNHSSELTKAFVKRNLKYLLDTYHVDGFRFDFTKGFTQKKTTGDDDLAATDASRMAILEEYYNAVKAAKPDALVIMEHFCSNEESTLSQKGICFWRNLNYAYCQSGMGWSEGSDFGGMYDRSMNFVGYMESHDEERVSYKQSQWGNGTLKSNLANRMSQLEANAAFFLTVPGPKMIWQFGEMGYDISIDENDRTGRKPIHWEYLDDADRAALQETYSKLIALRNAHPALFGSDASFSWQVGVGNWDSGRFLTSSTTTENLVTVGNFTTEQREYAVTFPVAGVWYNYLTGEKLEIGDTTQKLTLPAHTAYVFTTFQ